jgi:hypothetical protein
MDNEIVIVRENVMMGPKWFLFFFFIKSFSWTMLSNSKNIIVEWMSPPSTQLLSKIFDKFKKSHGTLDKEWKKKPPLLTTTIINRFEKSCGTFKGGGGNNSLSSTTLG